MVEMPNHFYCILEIVESTNPLTIMVRTPTQGRPCVGVHQTNEGIPKTVKNTAFIISNMTQPL